MQRTLSIALVPHGLAALGILAACLVAVWPAMRSCARRGTAATPS